MLQAVDWVAGQVATPLSLRVRLADGLRLGGRVERVRSLDGGLVLEWVTASRRPNERLRLTAWLHLVAAVAAGHPVRGARIVAATDAPDPERAAGTWLAFDGDSEQAGAVLQDCLAVWRQARRLPARLFARTSPVVAELALDAGDALHGGGPGPRELRAVSEAFFGTSRLTGDVEELWVQPLFGDYDPTADLTERAPEGLVGLARRVWGPLLAGARAGETLSERWAPGGEVTP